MENTSNIYHQKQIYFIILLLLFILWFHIFYITSIMYSQGSRRLMRLLQICPSPSVCDIESKTDQLFWRHICWNKTKVGQFLTQARIFVPSDLELLYIISPWWPSTIEFEYSNGNCVIKNTIWQAIHPCDSSLRNFTIRSQVQLISSGQEKLKKTYILWP